MDENEQRNNVDELAFSAITALNALMVDDTIAKSSKAVVKINRFKLWLFEYWKQVSNNDHTNDREQ